MHWTHNKRKTSPWEAWDLRCIKEKEQEKKKMRVAEFLVSHRQGGRAAPLALLRAQPPQWLQPDHPQLMGHGLKDELLQPSTFAQWCWLAAGRTEELSSCWIPPCAAAHIWVFQDLCDFRGHGSLWKGTKTGNLSQL